MTTAAELEPDLADRLAKSLQVAGLSVAEMAAYMEVHRNSVGGWLNRRTEPRPANIRLWAIRTGVPYEWLRYGTWPEESEQVNGT
jgi:transcriptional regulator with XRE-family HTH domain